MGHVVWTLDEVKTAVPAQDTFWLSDCGCRELKKHTCEKSARRCLGFHENATSSKTNLGKVTRKEADELFALAKTEKLVPRPWVSDNGKLEGVCFCCHCCCWYFTGKPDAVNVAGPSIETTDMALCIACGACVDVCYFEARKMVDGVLRLDRSKCYGCGLCVDACGPGVISMKPR